MTLLPKVKLKAAVNFPANVFGRTGIAVLKENGTFYLDLDYSTFNRASSLPANSNNYALVYDVVLKTYVLVPLALLGGGGGISEAPADGFSYGRLNTTWGKVAPLNNPALTGTVQLNGLSLGQSDANYLTLGGSISVGIAADHNNYHRQGGHVFQDVPGTTTFANINVGAATFSVPVFVPTPTAGDSSTRAASTAFVTAAVAAGGGASPATVPPLMDGAAAVGTSLLYARQDHVHPSDTSRAPLASPALTGVPTAPTAAPGTNTTQLASTAFVAAAVAGGTAGVASIGGQTGAITLQGGGMSTPELPAPRYDLAQTLTATQQQQARQNIYAAPLDALAYNGMQINGGMEVSQQFGTAGVSGGYTVDGWYLQKTGTGSVSGAQYAWNLNGFPNLYAISASVAQPSIGTGDIYALLQNIEGFRVARLGWGGSFAAPVTLGFWTAHTRTGVYSGTLRNGATNRSYAFTYTQNVSTAMEYKTVTIPGDTAGTWAKDNTSGLMVTFAMAMGSTYTAPSAGSWVAGNFMAAPGQINGVAATSDVFRITGVGLFPGMEAPLAARSPFIMRPFDYEIRVCQRYYWKSFPYLTAVANAAGVAGAISYVVLVGGAGIYNGVPINFPVAMRAAPTVTSYNPTNANSKWWNQNAAADSGVFSGNSIGPDRFMAVNNPQVAGDLISHSLLVHAVADARL